MTLLILFILSDCIAVYFYFLYKEEEKYKDEAFRRLYLTALKPREMNCDICGEKDCKDYLYMKDVNKHLHEYVNYTNPNTTDFLTLIEERNKASVRLSVHKHQFNSLKKDQK